MFAQYYYAKVLIDLKRKLVPDIVCVKITTVYYTGFNDIKMIRQTVNVCLDLTNNSIRIGRTARPTGIQSIVALM